MRIGIALLALLLALPAAAKDFYIDPATGSDGNDGSAERPWRTLQAVIAGNRIETRDWSALPYQPGRTLVTVNPGAPVKAGDTLWLRSGYHGELVLRGAYNAAPITIAAQPGHRPRLSRVAIESAQHWVLRGLSISPSHASTWPTGTIVTVQDHNWFGPAWDIELDDSDVFTVADASAWGVSQWLNTARNGVAIFADRVTVRRSRLRNLRHGMDVAGDGARIRNNVIDGFSADGIRGLGNDGVYEYNLVRNNYLNDSVDGNHDDGFQSWSVGPGGVGTGEVRGVVLRGNVFVNVTAPNHPLRSTMQGIGCFDGLFVDWVVENNVVITDHWHGITFAGMRDSRIVNNTVIDINAVSPGPPWIMVAAHKDGRASRNVVVRNNLAMQFSLDGSDIVADHNLTIANPSAYFVAPPYDLRLKLGSPAIDVGSAALAPALDVRLTPRPQGAGVDLGAYEFCAGGSCPADQPIPADGAMPLIPPRLVPPQPAGAVSGAAAAAAAIAPKPVRRPAAAAPNARQRAPARPAAADAARSPAIDRHRPRTLIR